jgi:hypothetical protein
MDVCTFIAPLGWARVTAIDVGNPALMRAPDLCPVSRADRASRNGGRRGASFPSMLTNSRLVDRKFPILIHREAPDQHQEKRRVFSCAIMRKGREHAKFPILFPVNGNLPVRRPVSRDCVHHHSVRGNSAVFLVWLRPRHFRGLAEGVSYQRAQTLTLAHDRAVIVAMRSLSFPKNVHAPQAVSRMSW